MTDDRTPEDQPRRRRGGRPRKAESERQDGVLSIRLPLSMRVMVAERAEAAGLSLADYGRAALDGNPVTVIVSQIAPPEVIQQLRMIGGNVRQGIVAVQGGRFADPALEQEVGAALAAAGRAVSDQLRWLIHGSEVTAQVPPFGAQVGGNFEAYSRLCTRSAEKSGLNRTTVPILGPYLGSYVPNVSRGRSFDGVTDYITHDKREAFGNGQTQNVNTAWRVGFIRLMNFDEGEARTPEEAAEVMTQTADDAFRLRKGAGHRSSASNSESVYHLSLSWAIGEQVDEAAIMEAAHEALAAAGLGIDKGYQTYCVEHTDTDHPHIHIVVNLVHPVTGKKANPYRDKKKLQAWADGYDRRRGKVLCRERAAIYASRDRARARHVSREARAEFDRAETATGSGPRRQTRRGDPNHPAKADRYGRDRSKVRQPRQPFQQQAAPPRKSAMWTQFRQAAGDTGTLEPARIIEALTAQASTFTRRDLARHVWTRTADADAFRAIMAKVEAAPELVRLHRDTQGVERFTARDLQAIERQMIEDAATLHSQTGHGVSARHRQQASRAIGLKLSDEQESAFRHITGTERIAAVVGFAGSGKSTMLGAARLAWQAAGYRVRGAALSGIAADGLQGGAGIDSSTIHSLLYALDKGTDRLTGHDVLVVDEAGMIGSRLMARLLAHTARAGAKIVLVGDPEQLQAIDAGAAFRAIKERIGAAEITEIRRQREGWQQDATRDLATERTGEALDRYEQAGMLHGHATSGEAKTSLLESWNKARHDKPDQSRIILAYKRADVRDFNEQARAIRREAGDLGPDHELQTEQGPRRFATGDRLYFLKNDKRLGVRNGSLGTVEAIAGDTLTVKLDGGKRVSFSLTAYSQIDHGYAATVHKSQGVTVDRAFVLATKQMDRHAAYVAMTRHRDRLDLHWSTDSLADRVALAHTLSRARSKDTTLDYGTG